MILIAAVAAFPAWALPAPASAFNVEIVNNSGLPDDQVYVMLDGGSSSDGQMPNDVSKPLSSITNSTFSLGAISAGRMYFSYGAAVTNAEQALTATTRFDKIEFTNPGVANLTSVDFFGIPLDVETLDSTGTSLGNALSFRCHTSTVQSSLLSIPGASAAQVTSGGQFMRMLSSQLSSSSYPSMAQYVQSMIGETIQVNDAFYGTPFQTFSYSGTFQPDGSITLNGTITTSGSTVAGSTVYISGSSLLTGIYTGDTPFTVNGVPSNVTAVTPYSNIYRDIVAGFTFGYWGGQYGDDSANWNHQPAFAAARTTTSPFATWNQYASTIAEYSDAYGYSFHDVGPTSVTTPLNSSVATMQVTIDSDQGPNTPGCIGASTPTTPTTPAPPATPPANPGKVQVSIDSGSAKLDKRGRAVLLISCSGDPCKGELTLTGKSSKQRVRGPRSAKRKRKARRAKTLVLGKSTFSIAERKTQAVRVQITKKGLRTIKQARGRSLRVLARALVGPKSTPTTADTRRVTLKAYKAPKHRRR